MRFAAALALLAAGCTCEMRAAGMGQTAGGEQAEPGPASARPPGTAQPRPAHARTKRAHRPAVRIHVQQPQTHAGVVQVEQVCNAQAPETFNGRDDNCNGQIDEGFVGSGAIQVTLWWDTDADVDLYVVDPAQNEISYQNRESPTGGLLDRDARGTCISADRQTTENVYWHTETPPSGQYQVLVDYYQACGQAATTPIVLSISVGGQVVGTYQYELNPTDRRLTMATFQIP